MVLASVTNSGMRQRRAALGLPYGDDAPLLIDADGNRITSAQVPLHLRRARLQRIGIETNGTIEPPDGMDWVCVSPKAGAGLVVRRGHELKLVYPQAGAAPEDFAGLDFERFSLQPMDGPDVIENTARTVDYCLRHPQWRLSLQTHKTLGIR